MANHGDVVYTDSRGYTHYSDGTTSYNMGGYTFYSDGSKSYELGGKRFYDDGSTSYEASHKIFHSDGSTSNNYESLGEDLADSIMGIFDSDSGASSESDSSTEWVRTPSPTRPLTKEECEAERRTQTFLECVVGFLLGCYYALYITIGTLIVLWLSGFSPSIKITYAIIAIISGIVGAIINSR